MSHANAPFAPEGRLRIARLVVERGWSVRRVAERFQCSPATAKKWVDRYRVGQPMVDRSSRPHYSPARLDRRTERRVVALRFGRKWGARRIAWHLGLNPSTVGRVLVRYQMPHLSCIDQATGLPTRRAKPVRYQAAAPGDLVHVDIKKLGRIPGGGGHRVLGRQAGRRNSGRRGTGYAFLHHAVDDCTRLAYSEQLADERKETAAAFWHRARAFFAEQGIAIGAVMTDNGSCYRSQVFAAALGESVRHIRTRPYRPQTNGKVERFNRTLATEWAYAEAYASDEARSATYQAWIDHYNHERPHSALGGHTPACRIHNLTSRYT